MRSSILHIVTILSISHSAKQESDDCFSLSQKLKALYFNKESSEAKIKSIRQRLLDSESNEKSLMDQLSSAEHDLVDTETEARILREQASALKDRLLHVERIAEEANNNLTTLSHIHRESSTRLRLLKESTEALASLHTSLEERARKYELKLNMLQTDVGASLKTLNDARETLQKRAAHEAGLRKSATNATARMLKFADDVTGLRGEISVVETQVERLHREITDENGLLDTRVSEEESNSILVAESLQKLDNTRAELQSLRQAYKLYINGTLNHLFREIIGLTNRGNHLIDVVGRKMELEGLRDAANTTATKHFPNDELSPVNLRDVVRQSRTFLSEHGYKYPISLIQTEASSGIDPDLLDFWKLSSRLAKIRELSEVDEALGDANIRLSGGLKHIKELNEGMTRLHNRSVSEEAKLLRNNASTVTLRTEIARVRNVLNVDHKRLLNETSTLKHLHEELSSIEAQLKTAVESSMHTNQTLTEAILRTRSSEKDVLVHESTLEDMRDAVRRTEIAAAKMRDDAQQAQILLQDGYKTTTGLQNNTVVLMKDVDDEQRFYLEEMADVSEISRRLNEFIRRIADAESARDRLIFDVGALKTQIRTSLTDREGLTGALEAEIRTRNEFVDRISGIESYLDRKACTK